MYKQGIEVKKEIDVGVVVEKSSWFSFVESLYPKSERIHHPNDQDDLVYINLDDIVIGFIAGQGSSIAACMTERLRVYGAKAIIRIGTCGALSRSVKLWTPIVTTACFSSEGTSGHYLPKGYPIISDVNLNDILIKKITEAGIDYQRGITITTDGRWRENPVLLKEINKLGVMSIEMETAAILSVCQFRKIPVAAINIPADLPTKEDDKNDLKGVPNIATYHSDIKKIMTKMIPIVVDTLKEYYKEMAGRVE
ncbi:nucleoside phosphorylase [Patescibacteria group bacterium]